MTYPRVNLLKKDERRYQGAVSQNFILLCGIGTPILITLLVIGLYVAHSVGVKSQLKSSQALWDDLEPRLKSYSEGNKGLLTNRKILDLFNGWQASQISFVELLSDFQDATPKAIQFSRLSIRSGESKAIYETPTELKLGYILTLEGVAFGAQAENEVILLQKDLLASEQLGSAFAALKLDSMRKRQKASGENIREFRLVGTAEQGEGK